MRPRGAAALAVAAAALGCAPRCAAWYLPGVAPKVRGARFREAWRCAAALLRCCVRAVARG
jgi:hypothetical protein